MASLYVVVFGVSSNLLRPVVVNPSNNNLKNYCPQTTGQKLFRTLIGTENVFYPKIPYFSDPSFTRFEDATHKVAVEQMSEPMIKITNSFILHSPFDFYYPICLAPASIVETMDP
jgi:hypothetical protein